MRTLLVLGVVGFFAQLVDGALGMGYGATSSSLWITCGSGNGLRVAVVRCTQPPLSFDHISW